MKMIKLYKQSEKGVKACNCDPSQVGPMMEHGWSKEIPEEKPKKEEKTGSPKKDESKAKLK